jgi:hypothetical protein
LLGGQRDFLSDPKSGESNDICLFFSGPARSWLLAERFPAFEPVIPFCIFKGFHGVQRAPVDGGLA